MKYWIKNKELDTDNYFYKSVGDDEERKLISEFPIKRGDGIVFVSECKSDKEVQGTSVGSGESRLRCL